MSRAEKISEQTERARVNLDRLYGSAPWLRAKEVKHFKAKIFKSGNSLALRLPAGLGLSAGMEMNLRVEDDESFSFEASDRPRKKFNVGKIWGSATGLELIQPADRVFEDRRLLWDEDQPPSEPK
jgi:antitoxin VapB